MADAYGANWKLAPAGPMLDGSHQLEAATRSSYLKVCLDPPKLNRICSAQRVAIYIYIYMGP